MRPKFFSTTLLCLISLSLTALASAPKYGVITGVKQYANLRTAPTMSGTIIDHLPLGTQIEILQSGLPSQDQGKWATVYPLWNLVKANNKTGYIAAKFISFYVAATPTIRIDYDSSKPFQEVSTDLFQPKQLLLTLDDGPQVGVTDKILDLLQRHNIQAVFFVNGYTIRAARNHGGTALIERMHREGHIIANHTDRHHILTNLNDAEREKEIKDCHLEIEKEFKSFGGTWKSVIFRFPSTASKHQNGSDLREEIHKKYGMICGSPTKIHGQDWEKDKQETFILQKLQQTTQSQTKGTVILHELPKSLKALEKYIPWALQQGYHFVRLEVNAPGTSFQPSANAYPGLPAVKIDGSLKKTQYHQLYYKWGTHYGVDWRLLKAIAIVESSENPNVVNQFGYTGLFQIGDPVLDGFNKKHGTTWTKPSLKDPDRNTQVGAWLTSRNYKVLAKPELFGTFLNDPVHLAVTIYCAHNYGIGLVKSTIENHRKQNQPMTFDAVFNAIEKAGKQRYGDKAGEAKMKVAKKVGALYQALLQKLGTQP